MMKIRNILWSLVMIFTLLSLKCKKDNDNCHYTVPYKNDTGKSLYFISSISYPDTVLGNGSPNPLYNPALNHVKPYSLLSYKDKECIEMSYNYFIKSGLMMVFVFDEEVLKNNDWETVKSNNMYLQRYNLSLEDLRKLNFIIPYPATPAMKDMKMWPKYMP